MTATSRRYRMTSVWASFLCALLGAMSASAKVTVVTLSQLVGESDTIVYGSFMLSSKRTSQSPDSLSFVPVAILKGKDLTANGTLTFCNPSGERAPDLSRMKGPVVIFANKQLECLGLAHGGKSIVRIKAGRARTGTMDDQPEAQSVKSLLDKIRALVPKKSAV